MTAADVEQRADLLARNSDRIGHSHVAATTNGALDFGLMRMEEVQVEAKAQYELEVFHSIENVRAWLRTVTVEELRDTPSVPVG
ncbi:MAG: hypothetical protein ACXVZ1_09220 [Gaiellaceae bacterium]